MKPYIFEPPTAPEWQQELIALIKDHGNQITPEEVLKHAKKTASALHRYFTWDDSIAAHKQRLSEATGLLLRVKLTMIDKDENEVRIPAVVNVRRIEVEGDEKKSPTVFMWTPKVLDSQELTDDMMDKALRSLQSARRLCVMYESLAKWKKLIKDIDAILEDETAKKATTKSVL